MSREEARRNWRTAMRIRVRIRKRNLAAAMLACVVLGVGAGGVGAQFFTSRDPQVAVVQALPHPGGGGVDLPHSTLITEGGETVVYVAISGRVFRQPVTVSSTSGATILTDSVVEGSKVVDHPGNLHDGERIRVQGTGG
jgi:hypothetical protein